MNTHHNSRNFIKPFRLISVFSIMAMILAACAPATALAPSPTVLVPAPTILAPTQAAPSVAINIATDPVLGKLLVDSGGKTLYIFTKDTPDTVNCDAKCQANWPPLVSSGTPKVGPGVDASLVGSATLPSGQKVVTYDHMPLYTFIKDTQPGQVSGEDVGSVWFVVSPDGKPVKPASVSVSTPTSAPAASVPTLMVSTDVKLGQILVDGKGMTLYVFTKDTPDKSNCTGSCLVNWPLLLTSGAPNLGSGVDDSLVAVATLSTGEKVVTYNHMPLYTFIKDTKPGDISGEGVGSVWYVISPDGKLVQTTAQTTPTSAPAAGSAEPTLMLASNPALGSFLVDAKGMTLYAFTNDTPDKSNCTGSCLTNWPPLLTLGSPKIGTGVDDSKIGSALLADGTRIVTYNHMPLYYFIKDKNPGDTTGQGVGSVWYVVNPDSEIIK